MAGAQPYHPMLKDGKRWQCYYTNGFYELNFNYYLDGDTVIDGEKGLRLFAEVINQMSGKVFTPYGCVGAIVEKDRQAFMIAEGKRALLFDFNLKVGDTVPGNLQWKVVDVRNIHVMGAIRKCLTLKRGGQDVHRPFLDEGKEWWYKDNSAFGYDSRGDFRMFIKEDTIIGGNTWKKVYRDNTPGSVPVYEKALREEDGKVYELRQGGEESLMFDFSLNIGDHYVPAGSDGRYMEVIAIDTMMSAGIAHRRLILMQHLNGADTDLTSWIEGIGGDCGIDLPAFWSDMDPKVINARGGTDYYHYLFTACLKQDGTCLFGETPSVRTAVTSILKPTAVSPNYDLQGRRLTKQPRKGVYIRDGRKVVVK